MKIRFIKQPRPNAGGEEFAVGEVYELDDPSAWRWVRRKVAEVVEIETADAAPKKRRGRPRKSATQGPMNGTQANDQTGR